MSSQNIKKLHDVKKTNNHSIRERLRLWLLEHPELNPYRFSVGLTLDPAWQEHPNNFSIGRAFQMATSSIRILPDFIIIGSSKSGTWAIHNYLLQHPDIDYSARNIHFFEYAYSNKISWYKSHFPTKLYKSLVESIHKRKCLMSEHTSTYLHHPLIPQRVKDGIPDVKLIVSLRNPIDRAYSNYHMFVRIGTEKRTFEDAVFSELKRIEIIKENDNFQIKNPNFSNCVESNYLRHGTYVDKLENWLKSFRREQFCIVENKDLSKNPQQVLDKIFEFLNVPHFKLRQEERWNVGEYKKMKESTRKTLQDFFKPYNERLYKLLSQNFSWD
jgi:hypothetical protein